MIQQESPCLTCTRRSAICHAQCEEYHTWAAERRAKRKAAWGNRSKTEQAEERLIDSRIAKRRRNAR